MYWVFAQAAQEVMGNKGVPPSLSCRDMEPPIFALLVEAADEDGVDGLLPRDLIREGMVSLCRWLERCMVVGPHNASLGCRVKNCSNGMPRLFGTPAFRS